MAITIASVLRRSGGRAPGVTQTRALLVLAWIVFQSIRLTEGNGGAVLSPLWVVPHVVIPALFAMLGFCLAQAAADQPVRAYLLDRVRHAGPALLVVVLAAALVLGPAVSSSSLTNYVSDPAFALYFLNLVGWPRFDLPGVFEFDDYAQVVNEALWLTPCFVVAAISALGVMKSSAPRRNALLAAGATLIIYAAAEASGLMASPGASVMRDSYIPNGLAAIFAAQCGMLGHAWRARFPIGRLVLFGPLVAIVAVAVLIGPDAIDLPGVVMVLALLAAASALAIATRRLPGSWVAQRTTPVLHGAMLFSFPLQQLAADLGPGRQSASINLALALPIAVAVAWGLNWLSSRVGFSPAPAEPDLEAPVVAAPSIRRSRSLKHFVRQSTAGLGIALFVATVGLVVILLTVFALQADPIGV